MFIKLEEYVMKKLNFMSDLFILIYSGWGEREVHETCQGGAGYKRFGNIWNIGSIYYIAHLSCDTALVEELRFIL
jgi:hypothetical protein